jgi:hypothetical protein
MAKYGASDPTLRDMILEQVAKMLSDPSCEVSMERGMKRIVDYREAWVQHEPTDGFTLTLKVNGGAGETTEVRWAHPLAMLIEADHE